MGAARISAWIAMTVLCSCAAAPPTSSATRDRLTILYDAFGKPSALKADWGFAALVETAGKRILFDTGNNSDIFAHNVRALGVDLTRLDFAVISHRHGDHTDGLRHLLRVNPDVTIYTPRDLGLRLIAGGLHLAASPDEAIASTAAALRDKYRLRQVAPGHCTGEPAFAALREAFGDRYVQAGLGVR